MRHLLPLFTFILLLSCGQNPEQETASKPDGLRDRIPETERELLLIPLESALDDLRASVESNEIAFSSSEEMTSGDVTATFEFKLDGKDTIMLRASLKQNGDTEEHEWFFDQQKRLFYSHHEFMSANGGISLGQVHEAFKFYYEENGNTLSSYGKYSNEGTLPEQWTPVCLSAGKEGMLRGRMNAIRELAAGETGKVE